MENYSLFLKTNILYDTMTTMIKLFLWKCYKTALTNNKGPELGSMAIALLDLREGTFFLEKTISTKRESKINKWLRTWISCLAVGASSQCYWEELMLLKCELMLLKFKINKNTNKNGFLLPTKCLERVLKYSY